MKVKARTEEYPLARKLLAKKKQRLRESRERDRKALLEKVVHLLREALAEEGVSVFLIGSITRPYRFGPASDIDVVVKSYKGDRLSLWSRLDSLLPREVDLIFWESCPFREDLEGRSLKVV